MKISEIITDKYKLRIPPTVYYDLLADAQEAEEEQEPIIDKIRAEIEQEYNRLSATRADETLELGECLGLKMSLKIIDKYRAGGSRRK